jgi:hypothetical protein
MRGKLTVTVLAFSVDVHQCLFLGPDVFDGLYSFVEVLGGGCGFDEPEFRQHPEKGSFVLGAVLDLGGLDDAGGEDLSDLSLVLGVGFEGGGVVYGGCQ